MTTQADAFDIQSIPFRGLVEQALTGVYIIQDEIFQYVNATWATMTGHTPEEMVGQPVSRFVPPQYVDSVIARYHRRVSGVEPSMRFIVHGLHKNGSTVLIDVHGTALAFRGRPAVVGVGIDVTEQVAKNDQLQRSQRQYQELAAYLIAVRERQRSAYAREVHDVLGGILTSMKLNVGRILRRTEAGDIKEIAEDLNGLLQEAINNVREISESLHPQALEYLGLSAAIGNLLERFEKRSGIHAVLIPKEMDIPLSTARATNAFRIIQEALTNVARHSQATQVEVRTAIQGSLFRIEILDNGRGMDIGEGEVAGFSGRSFGILSMTERARELNGKLDVVSTPGTGVIIVLTAPIQDAE